jgi:sugar phosphate isomerase/epimerase
MLKIAGRPMKLGLMTACLRAQSLEAIAAWAAGAGFEALEVATWPKATTRDFQAAHIDVAQFGQSQAEAVQHLFEKYDLTLSALAYYENNLHCDPERRSEVHEHLRRCVDAAELLGVSMVGTFIGRDNSLSVTDNLLLGEKVLPDLVGYASDRGVKLVVENCPMEGWHPDGYPGNLAYSPELWEWMFDLGFYLNFDPSHLIWLGIDPVEALRPYVDRVLHAQAKDTQLDAASRNRYGYFGKVRHRASSKDVGWWRYRVPGRGLVDWSAVIDTLYEGGFDGVMSVEHEDPVWGGDEERVRRGLTIAHQTLRPLIIA